MVSKFILFFGLVCAAGLAAGQDDYESGTGLREIKNRHKLGEHYKCTYCNLQLIQLLRFGKKTMQEEGYNYFESPYACHSIKDVNTTICLQVQKYLRDMTDFDEYEGKDICTKVGYCFEDEIKFNPHKKTNFEMEEKQIPQIPQIPQKLPIQFENKDRFRPQEHALTTETTSACRNCQLIMRKAGKVREINMAILPQFLPYLCSEFMGKNREYCFHLIDQYKNEIMPLLKNRASPEYICHALRQCRKPPSFCRACMTYVNDLYGEDGPPSEEKACSYLNSQVVPTCMFNLVEHKEHVQDLVENEVEPHKICKVIKMCGHSAK